MFLLRQIDENGDPIDEELQKQHDKADSKNKRIIKCLWEKLDYADDLCEAGKVYVNCITKN